ncbi:hypothetical protein ZIOFF_073014 [Zingiber officinale]|uniref:indole-3-glycerol-phosphate synthase n=1 Tax=Zingiber officinale TaxID=94328 RepID=A0A8J5BXZ7_ZINOF|nr:hypothetical protein ZIOFF_073014 [Zingiber officinale]
MVRWTSQASAMEYETVGWTLADGTVMTGRLRTMQASAMEYEAVRRTFADGTVMELVTYMSRPSAGTAYLPAALLLVPAPISVRWQGKPTAALRKMAAPAAAGFFFAPFQFRQVKSFSSSDKPSISLHAPLGISPLYLFAISKNLSRRDVSSRCSVDPNTLLEEEEEAEEEAAEKRRELNSTNLPWDTPTPRVEELFDQCGAEKDVEETTLASTSVTAKEEISNSLKFPECQNGKLAEDVAAVQGVKIRRRPPTGPSKHYVGPFEFRLENEGNTPRNILEKIIWDKESELKERRPLITIMKALENAPPVRDFIGTLKASYEHTGMPALIAEVKKASPSRGVLRENFDPPFATEILKAEMPYLNTAIDKTFDIVCGFVSTFGHLQSHLKQVEVANSYEKNGAACISVLTDEKYFQGSFENLEAIRRAGVKCPLLCKEFIVDAWQIYYARSKGADAILLIAAVLTDLDIKYLTKICRLLGLAALIEVHNESELNRVLGIEGVQLIGINNRNLETFEVDISNTKSLLDGERGELIRQRDIIVVSESGLFTPEDISYVQDAGIKAVLVGESLIKQDDPGGAISGLFGKSISVR